VRVIDPAPAVARQVARMLDKDGIRAVWMEAEAPLIFTSGELTRFKTLLPRLIDEAGKAKQVFWKSCEIHLL
jgi:glutamate racemase